MDRQEGGGLGNPTGPQGSAALDSVRERGGNLVGPRLQSPDGAGDPLVRQPDPSRGVSDPVPEGGSSEGYQRGPGFVYGPFSGQGSDLRGLLGDSTAPRRDPLSALGGQGQDPPHEVPSGGGQVGAE